MSELARLRPVLERAKARGMLGPGPVMDHIRQAESFVTVAAGGPARALDLGAGAGVPGLVLAVWWPSSAWVLLEGSRRRVALLEAAVAELDLGARARVLWARAESAGQDDRWRGGFDLVVARSFAPPAVTAECGAPFLAVGGRLLVAEPPAPAVGRWPPAGLALLGLAPEAAAPAAPVVAFAQVRACPAEFPRGPGVPARRPLWAPPKFSHEAPPGERSSSGS